MEKITDKKFLDQLKNIPPYIDGDGSAFANAVKYILQYMQAEIEKKKDKG